MKRYPGGTSVREVEASVVRKEGDDSPSATYIVSASSEHPVERRSFGVVWREVLEHSRSAIQLERFESGSAAVLEEHKGAPVGVVKRAWLDDDKKLRAEVLFSRSTRGQEVRMDVEDGIRRNISIGYIPKEATLVEENEASGDLWRVTLWEPVELSFVGIPADPTVGVNRSAETAEPPRVEVRSGEAAEEGQVSKINNESGTEFEVKDEARATRSSGVSDSDRDEMLRLAEMAGETPGRVSEWIRSGKSVREIMGDLLEARLTKASTQPSAETLTEMGLSQKDARRYSYSRAIMGAALVSEGKRFDGVEREVHEELVKRQPTGASLKGGVLVPLSRGVDGVSTRTMTSNTATKGAEVVFEQSGELIELLRNRSAVMALGARSLTGLTAPIAFPKQTAAMTAYWVGENPAAAVTASDMALGVAHLAPKNLQATTSYSRQLLAQASVDIESMVTNELGLVHALAIDYAAIHGLGAAGEPTGIYSALNVGFTTVGGAMSYSKVLAMQGQVAAANADLGTLGWLMHPTMATNLKGTAMFANTATPVWTGDYANGSVGGYRAYASAQVSKTMVDSARDGGSQYGAIFGNWNDLIVGFWGALELVVDPYSQKKTGLIEVTSFQMADVLCRHGESFSKSHGATS